MNRSVRTRVLFSRWRLILVLGGSIACGCGTSQTVPPSTPPPTPPPASAAVGDPAAGPPPQRQAQPAPVLLSAADLDLMMDGRWESAHVSPAGRSDDSEFLRRVTLDVAGRIPTVDEAERFLADHAANKRERLVTDLLASPDYAAHWADVYLDLFIGRQFRKPRLEKKLDPRGYFLKAFGENRRLDRIAYEMLTFSGEILPNGPGIFLASHLKGGGPEMAASVTARLFLGIQIQCAQCHDHPYDARYKQEDFYGLVAYFARTKERTQDPAKNPNKDPAKDRGKDPTQGSAGQQPRTEPVVEAAPMAPGMAAPNRALDAGSSDNKTYSVFDKPNGQAKFRRPGATEDMVVRPKFLGRAVAAVPGEIPRQTLARAVTESDLFGKTIVDRTWSQLFGHGIVDPWDDLGGEADPRHPPLLARLAEDLRASGFDFKHLLRTLLLSRAYGLTSRRIPVLAAAAATATGDAGIGADDSDARPTPARSPSEEDSAGLIRGRTALPPTPRAFGATATGPTRPATPTSRPLVATPSDATAGDPTAEFAQAAVRRLSPEQLFRSLLVATGADRMQRPGAEDMEKKINRLLREYLFVFEDDEMAEINTFNGNIPQALLMWNGEIVNQGAKARAGGVLAGILDGTPEPQARLQKMFLAAYARPPSEAESARLLPALTEEKSGRARYEDLFFAMLTSTEMLTIH